MVALLLPFPATKLRPTVPLSVSVPRVAVRVSCIGAPPASTSVTRGALAPASTKAVSSLTDMGAGKLSEGASLTAVTETVNVELVVVVPSDTLSVIVAGPPLLALLALAAGVTVRVRLLPLPPSTRPVLATSAVLLEVAVTSRLPAAVSASPTVKANGPAAVSSATVWLLSVLIVGAWLVVVLS